MTLRVIARNETIQEISLELRVESLKIKVEELTNNNKNVFSLG